MVETLVPLARDRLVLFRKTALRFLCLSIAGVLFSGYRAMPAEGTRTVEAKVVRNYAITSANDFPQRDPQDWQLLGSNDNGTNWSVLDIRRGERFTGRHQRKVFAIANRQAFNLYRLQIDRVRDPQKADAVQIAEIEPLGDGEHDLEPAPLFQDHVTAQGENPPWESRLQAFDGRVETKWLDRAQQNPATRGSWIQWQYVDRRGLVVTNVRQLVAMQNRAAQNYPVRLEGVVVGMVGSGEICFLDGTGDIQLPTDGRRIGAGTRIRVEGRSAWTNGAVTFEEMQITTMKPAISDVPLPLKPGQALKTGKDWLPAEVEGTVGFVASATVPWSFELQSEGSVIAARVLHPASDQAAPVSGTRVKLLGACEPALNTAAEYVPGTIWLPDAAAISRFAQPEAVIESSPHAVGGSNVISSIARLRELTPQELGRRPAAHVRGVTTELFGAYMQDGKAGIELWYTATAAAQLPEFGSLIDVQGKADWAPGHGPIVRVEHLEVLGRGSPPVAELCSWSQLAGGRMVHRWVEIEGVVRSTDGSHLLLSCEGGRLMATIRSASAQQVRELVDATVRVRGVNVPATDSRGRMQGIQLVVPTLEQVEVRKAPPDPFGLPVSAIGNLLQFSASRELIHRVKVEGVLTFQDGRNYFVQDASGGVLGIGQEDVILSFPEAGQSWFFWQSASGEGERREPQFLPGDRVQIVGFPETRGFSPILTEVVVRKLGTAAPVRAAAGTLEDIARGSLDSQLVSLEAMLLRLDELGTHSILELQSGQKIFQAFLAAPAGRLKGLTPGSRVRVSGVCQVEPSPYASLGQQVASFKLLVASAGDVQLLQRPSWWTLRRAMFAAAALVVVLAVALAWIALLRRQVTQRTADLRREIEEHEKTEALLAAETKRVHEEIEQRTRMEAEVERGHRELLRTSRLAGMAEVATSVLHNVGNVLNGVNVLAASVTEQIQKAKTGSVRNLAGLLTEHHDDLGAFMTEDNRGRQLPGYVQRLGEHMAEDQTRLLERMKALTESIQHIKEIVAMQQNYAKVFGHRETIPLADIVEDALRMHSGAMARHHIQLVRDFSEAPPVTVDRHKVLQILFNLLENAKYACEASGKPNKMVRLEIRANGEAVQVKVADNGIGIPRENLSRIFAQQFSTRKGGHGFGLHSSVLAAQEMGGSLGAESEGPAMGATFTLELPLKSHRE